MLKRAFNAAFTACLLFCWAAPPAIAGESAKASDCSTCHEDTVKAFYKSLHGSSMKAKSPALAEGSCTVCHGPADAHIGDPKKENIRMPDASACVQCHRSPGPMMMLGTPGHERNGVSCTECHAAGRHAEKGSKSLLAGEPVELCAKCHREEAGAQARPFSHRDGSKPFACTNCHSVHSKGRTGTLGQLGHGGVCLDCHTDKASPFVFQHPPKDAEGCPACHEPHGSTNPKMLTRRSVAELCLECHTDVPRFHDLSRYRYRNCQTCHKAVHGSNHSPVLLDE